jgi:hypothetical protein
MKVKKPAEDSPVKEEQEVMVRDLKNETEFLMSIYPNMFESELVEKLLKELDSFEQVRK